MTTQEVLQQCKVEGMIVKLPDIKLERSEYLEVKKSLELIGGKWKGGKTQGFVFEHDPAELLEAIANGEQRNLKQEYQFFPTPPNVANRMIDELPYLERYMRVLEPSAGDGAIIKQIFKYDNMASKSLIIDCFELMDINQRKLNQMLNVRLLGSDFLLCDLKDTYDFIIANPPFTKNQDILHVAKMYECLKPGGIMVTITSTSWTFGSQKMQEDFKVWLGMVNAEQVEVEQGAFKESGTTVGAMMLKIIKPVEAIPNIPDSIQKKLDDYKKSSTLEQSTTPDNETVNNPVDEIEESEENNLPVRTCRVCGCTDDDCRQCIKKTGHPCHWIEDDLCSACYIPPPEEIIKEMEATENEISKGISDLKKLLTNNNDDMNFFQQLAMQSGGVDMTIRIMTKNNSMTLNIMPGSGSSTMKPLLITGTPSEIDEQFFQSIMPGYDQVKSLVTNLDDVKAELEEETKNKKNAAIVKKSDREIDKKHADKKKAESKTEKAEEPQLF